MKLTIIGGGNKLKTKWTATTTISCQQKICQ